MERPIILKAHEVRGILDGRQTQLRRIVKELEGYEDKICLGLNLRTLRTEWCGLHVGKKLKNFKCSFGEVGDRIWAREAAYISPENFVGYLDQTHAKGRIVEYSINMDAEAVRCAHDYGVKQTSSALMPRWASRILLEIVSVRVERLQDMRLRDYEAQGFLTEPVSVESAVELWRELWDGTNGVGSHEANPWVWVIEFKRVEAQ